jgi:hypothetical protein
MESDKMRVKPPNASIFLGNLFFGNVFLGNLFLERYSWVIPVADCDSTGLLFAGLVS